MGFLFDRNRGINRHSTFRLTEVGKDKLSGFSGDAQCMVLVALETNGSCNLDELSRYTRITRGQLERLLPGMVTAGYVVTGAGSRLEDSLK